MNISVIILFTKNVSIKSRITHLLRSLAISDGIMVLVGGTMFTINCFHHKWIFGRRGNNYKMSFSLHDKRPEAYFAL